MKILLSVDMEGITGVTCPDDVRPNTPGWSHFRNIMTDEANAAISGYFDAGVEEVLVNDSHSSMRNLQIDRLDRRAKLLTGNHKTYAMMEGIQNDITAAAFIGYHTGAGKQGILSHTYLGNTYTEVWLNDVECSEGYLNSQFAAEFQVPIILITGDDLTIQDGKKYAPSAVGVAVKQCVDRYSAICLPPEITLELIRNGAKESVKQIKPVKPPAGPFTIRIQLDSTQPVIAACHIPGVRQVGPREIAFTLPSMKEALRCFGAVSTIIKSGIEQTYG